MLTHRKISNCFLDVLNECHSIKPFNFLVSCQDCIGNMISSQLMSFFYFSVKRWFREIYTSGHKMKNVFSISHQVNNSRPHCHCEVFPIVCRRTEDFILFDLYFRHIVWGQRSQIPAVGCVHRSFIFLGFVFSLLCRKWPLWQ